MKVGLESRAGRRQYFSHILPTARVMLEEGYDTRDLLTSSLYPEVSIRKVAGLRSY